jgi:hypothetical protein
MWAFAFIEEIYEEFKEKINSHNACLPFLSSRLLQPQIIAQILCSECAPLSQLTALPPLADTVRHIGQLLLPFWSQFAYHCYLNDL